MADTSFDDTIPLLGTAELGNQAALDRFDDEMNDRQHYMDGPLPQSHVARILKVFGTVDLDLSKQVLKTRDIDTLRAAYFRQGRALLSTWSGEKSKGSEFEALTAAFEILSNPFWFKQFEEYRKAEQKGHGAAQQANTRSHGKPVSDGFAIFGTPSQQDPFFSDPSMSDQVFSKDCMQTAFAMQQPCAAVITPPTSPSEFEAYFPTTGVAADVILHDLIQPRNTTKQRKKVVQFNLEELDPISWQGQENGQRRLVEEDMVTKSTVTGKESLLDSTSTQQSQDSANAETPAESTSSTLPGTATFKDPQQFMAYVQTVVSEAFQTVSTAIPEDAAKASAAVEAYMKEFSTQLSAASDKVSVNATAVHKSVMETLSVPDEKVESMLSVVKLENFQFTEALNHVEKEFKDASAKIQRSFTW